MTEDPITDLSKISGLFVIARNSIFTCKGKTVMPAAHAPAYATPQPPPRGWQSRQILSWKVDHLDQAFAGLTLTPYGKGHQKRGFLPLRDSIQCLTLALENPPAGRGEYRVFNQFQETYDIRELAHMVREVARDLGIQVELSSQDNPRIEAEEHYYNPDHQKLLDLGYEPTSDIRNEIRSAIGDLGRYVDTIRDCRESMVPKISWRAGRRRDPP